MKALAPGPNDWFVPHGWPDPDLSVEQGSAVWDALVAVVEAAERIAGGATHWDEANGQMDAIRHSVAALDEALGGETKGDWRNLIDTHG